MGSCVGANNKNTSKKQLPKPIEAPVEPFRFDRASILKSYNMEAPDHFLCPITCELMEDPVINSVGQTYERKDIEQWFAKGKRLDPKTNQKLQSTVLIPNYALKNSIQQYKEILSKFEKITNQQRAKRVQLKNALVAAQKKYEKQVSKKAQALPQKQKEEAYFLFVKTFRNNRIIGKINTSVLKTPGQWLSDGQYFEEVHEMVFKKMEIEVIPKPLLYFNGLKELFLIDNKIKVIENLQGLFRLEILALYGNNIQQINGLQNLYCLTQLWLNENQITMIKNIKTLTKLQLLVLHTNKIKRIENLNSLVNLEHLSLGVNNIEKIANLQSLKKMRRLILHTNSIKEIQNINQLTEMKHLQLGSNKIQKIKGLQFATKLVFLILHNNLIKQIKGLNALQALEYLDLGNNQIEKIQNLQSLFLLKIIYLNDNKIKKIENLDRNTLLNTLILSDNKIIKIENIRHLLQLKDLGLSNNSIDKIEQIDSLDNLENIYLYGNPLLNQQSQKLKIKQLEQLKNKKIKIINNDK